MEADNDGENSDVNDNDGDNDLIQISTYTTAFVCDSHHTNLIKQGQSGTYFALTPLLINAH